MIEKGKVKNDSNVKLTDNDGERMLKMIEKFRGDLYCMNGDATYGSKN